MRKRNYAGSMKGCNDRELHFYKGPVKQVMEVLYKAEKKDGQVVGEGLDFGLGYHDSNYICTFNEQGRMIHEITYSKHGKTMTTWNNDGKRLEEARFYGEKLSSVSTYSYDEQGRSTGYVSRNETGEIESYTENFYDELGYEVESTHHSRGQLFRRTVTVYEDEMRTAKDGHKYRNCLCRTEYKGDGTIESVHTRVYDKDGNNTEVKTTYTDEMKQRNNTLYTRKYNKHGDCIQHSTYRPDGSLEETTNFPHKYDKDGKKIEPPKTDTPAYDPYPLADGEREEMETDHHDNWTKNITFFEQKATSVAVRSYSYFGEPSANEPPFVHPLSQVGSGDLVKKSDNIKSLKKADAKWLATGGGTADNFPIERYYTVQFREYPSVVMLHINYVEATAVLKMLKEKFNVQIVQTTGSVEKGFIERMTGYVLSFKEYPGYLLHAFNIHEQDEYNFNVPGFIKKYTGGTDKVNFAQFKIYKPSPSSENYDDWFEEIVEQIMTDCALEQVADQPYINIIETCQTGFAMKEYPVSEDFEIDDLDINYGYGFEEFHDNLMDRFGTSTKGLVLFHGQPGTGKTYYIRHLLKSMAENNKVVIYMPPNMVDHLVEPSFMTFLSAEVQNFCEEGQTCVLLIEDAEPLLAKRQEGVRIQGVTNLLNLTDGLLNDMLKLQIICTFNVDLKKLDSALLRPGRLLARKEFKALDVLDANLLAQRLGIRHTFKKPATLGEIYSKLEDQDTLIHEVEHDRDASTILDDL